MAFRDKAKTAWRQLESAFSATFGLRPAEMNWTRLTDYLHRPRDPSSLAVTRLLFGLAMLLDIPDERGGATLERRWGDPRTCHFPLFPFLQPAPLPWMALVYAVMWLGALGVALGYKFRTSALMFALPYWYVLLIEKSFWNNHSYLFGLVGLLLLATHANRYLSVDAYLDPSLHDQPVPQWNYWLLKYQFIILYFLAGVKKGSSEWLSGYAMTSLSDHWVFEPFKIFLSTQQTDYLVVHWFAFLFDLTVAFWMCWRRTRTVAMLLCAAFHLMNSRLFRIGMFPWVCLATMPLFYPEDWPKTILAKLRKINHLQMSVTNKPKSIIKNTLKQMQNDSLNDGNNENATSLEPKRDGITDVFIQDRKTPGSLKRHVITLMVIIYMMVQAFLPFSHFITKGFNNWSDGLYGYSWDMMVYSWENFAIVVKVVDNNNNQRYYLKPGTWTPNDRWSRHGDMVYQYAYCIRRNILDDIERGHSCTGSTCDAALNEWREGLESPKSISRNISVYIDVWCSMNGRFQQRMFDPRVDLLRAQWSPWRPVAWLMPLLKEQTRWRGLLAAIRGQIHSRDNRTDVTFMADFPGYHLENFIAAELTDVTLTVLDGHVVYEPPVLNSKYRHLHEGQSIHLTTGESVDVDSGHFHKVHAMGASPSSYMYTFTNATGRDDREEHVGLAKKLPLWKEAADRGTNLLTFFKLVGSKLIRIFVN